MRLVIADTGPINYRVQIGEIELLHKLFEVVVIPTAVKAELCDNHAPLSVRAWMAAPPHWVEVHAVGGFASLPGDAGTGHNDFPETDCGG